MDIDELLAREGIRDLVARYNSYSDAGRFAPLFELFAEDAVMETQMPDAEPVRFAGRSEIERIFTGARERVSGQASTGGPAYIRHFTATHQIDVLGGGRAKGRCYFAVITDLGLDHWGRYVDEYVEHEGRWLFQDRKVTVEGRNPESWFAT